MVVRLSIRPHDPSPFDEAQGVSRQALKAALYIITSATTLAGVRPHERRCVEWSAAGAHKRRVTECKGRGWGARPGGAPGLGRQAAADDPEGTVVAAGQGPPPRPWALFTAYCIFVTTLYRYTALWPLLLVSLYMHSP